MKFFRALIDAGKTRDSTGILGILVENLSNVAIALFGVLLVISSEATSGIELLGIGSRQIQFGVGQVGIQLAGSIEVAPRPFRTSLLLKALIPLLRLSRACSFCAAGGSQNEKCQGSRLLQVS